MTSVFDLLEAIEKRPEMYVGESDSERGKQLNNLDFLLYGYSLAVQNHNGSEVARDFLSEFGRYLQQRFGWSLSAGPVAAIKQAAKNDEDAWQLFWKLAREFKESLLRSS